MTPDQLALLSDARLSVQARTMGLHISGLGEGDHSISHSDFRRLLGRGPRGMPKDDTLAGYVQELLEYGWVERRPGGQGSPIYTFCPPSMGEQIGSVSPTARGEQKLSPTTRGEQSTPLSPSQGGAKALARGASTTKPPPPNASARRFVAEAESLVGCRGALCDYLQERVDPDRQLAYAQAVAGIIEGTDEVVWMVPDGGHVHDDRPKIIAGCLNELRAGTEIGKYFPGPPGDVGNLRSKIKYKVRSLAGAATDKPRRRRSGALFPEAEPPNEAGAA